MLQVQVNGKEVTLKQTRALDQALVELGYRDRHYAVAVNGDFVPRGRYDAYELRGGESIEILSPMQGG